MDKAPLDPRTDENFPMHCVMDEVELAKHKPKMLPRSLEEFLLRKDKA